MISICIITKNESPKLERCLTSIETAFSSYDIEIIVVDTGSTDNTMEMARRYTDKIFEFEWCDDFSAARNYSVSKASGEYILILDSDEYIIECDIEKLISLIECNTDLVGRIKRIEEYMSNGEAMRSSSYFNRFFKKDLYMYRGRIHEQLVLRDDISGSYFTYNMPITILHDGYNGSATTKSKIARNLPLLMKDLEEFGDDPYTLFQIGRGYQLAEDYVKACEYYGRALEFDLDPKLEYVKSMVESYGYALINLGRAEAALAMFGEPNVYAAFSSSADFCFMMGLVYMNCEDFIRAIEEFEKAVTKPCTTEGANSYRAFYNIGVIYECLGISDKALLYYERCGNYSPALERIRQIKS